MILHCKSCKNKFSVIEEEINLEGKIVQCRHCNEQWIYESKTRYLENRLAELGEDLDKTEIKLNLKKDEHQSKIKNLENDLKIKIEELDKQKKLEEKVLAFEERLSNTEKSNSEQIEKKISSYERKEDINNSEPEHQIKVNSSDVVNIRVFDQDGKKNKEQLNDSKKRKRFRFFTPDRTK